MVTLSFRVRPIPRKISFQVRSAPLRKLSFKVRAQMVRLSFQVGQPGPYKFWTVTERSRTGFTVGITPAPPRAATVRVSNGATGVPATASITRGEDKWTMAVDAPQDGSYVVQLYTVRGELGRTTVLSSVKSLSYLAHLAKHNPGEGWGYTRLSCWHGLAGVLHEQADYGASLSYLTLLADAACGFSCCTD